LENAVDSMFDVLYTSLGREGGLTNLLRDYGRDGDDEEESLRNHWAEYRRFRNLYQGIIHHFDWHPLGKELQGYLNDLEPQEDEPIGG
jgi:hypothetical protein